PPVRGRRPWSPLRSFEQGEALNEGIDGQPTGNAERTIMTRLLGPAGSNKRRGRGLVLVAVFGLLVAAFTLPAAAKYVRANAALSCATASVLSGSDFEIDTNAN